MNNSKKVKTTDRTTLDEQLAEVYPGSRIPESIDQVDIIIELLDRGQLPPHEQKALKLLLAWYHSMPRFRIEFVDAKRIRIEANIEMSVRRLLTVLGAAGLGGVGLLLAKLLS